jgi:hypothetical protein
MNYYWENAACLYLKEQFALFLAAVAPTFQDRPAAYDLGAMYKNREVSVFHSNIRTAKALAQIGTIYRNLTNSGSVPVTGETIIYSCC